ncbi:MAG: fluoride efflux transporter CrcB [Chryseolinea sp.]
MTLNSSISYLQNNLKLAMDVFKILIVGAGGFLGSVSRLLMVRFIDQKVGVVFPYGTLTVNLVGSFLLGVIFALSQRSSDSDTTEHWRLFLATGFCGGFTTFSAFALENLLLMNNKMVGTFALYTGLSLLAGVLAVAFGAWCTRFL